MFSAIAAEVELLDFLHTEHIPWLTPLSVKF